MQKFRGVEWLEVGTGELFFFFSFLGLDYSIADILFYLSSIAICEIGKFNYSINLCNRSLLFFLFIYHNFQISNFTFIDFICCYMKKDKGHLYHFNVEQIVSNLLKLKFVVIVFKGKNE